MDMGPPELHQIYDRMGCTVRLRVKLFLSLLVVKLWTVNEGVRRIMDEGVKGVKLTPNLISRLIQIALSIP